MSEQAMSFSKIDPFLAVEIEKFKITKEDILICGFIKLSTTENTAFVKKYFTPYGHSLKNIVKSYINTFNNVPISIIARIVGENPEELQHIELSKERRAL